MVHVDENGRRSFKSQDQLLADEAKKKEKKEKKAKEKKEKGADEVVEERSRLVARKAAALKIQATSSVTRDACLGCFCVERV